jgi:hypothetical protein
MCSWATVHETDAGPCYRARSFGGDIGAGDSFQAALLFGAPVPTHRAKLTLARDGRRSRAILFCRGAMTTTPKTRSRRRSCAAAAIIRGQHVGRDTLANRRRIAARWRSIAPKQPMQLFRVIVSVQAERCRRRRDPAAPFDRVAWRSWPRISLLQFSYCLFPQRTRPPHPLCPCCNVRNEKSILRPSIRHQNERFS